MGLTLTLLTDPSSTPDGEPTRYQFRLESGDGRVLELKSGFATLAQARAAGREAVARQH